MKEKRSCEDCKHCEKIKGHMLVCEITEHELENGYAMRYHAVNCKHYKQENGKGK